MARVAAWYRKLFPNPRPIIGVVHLHALLGAPHAQRTDVVLKTALEDLARYRSGGVDGVIVENFGDAPFEKGRVAPHTIAAMARIASAMRAAAPDLPMGVNVLRNDARGAIAIAAACSLEFIRVNVLSGVVVTDQGIIEGEAAAVVRDRSALASQVRIFADLRVKHAAPMREADLGVEVEELIGRAHADAVLVTGSTTGRAPTEDYVGAVRGASESAPVLIASGVDRENLAPLLAVADGLIVGTSMKVAGRTQADVDPKRVRALVTARDTFLRRDVAASGRAPSRRDK